LEQHLLEKVKSLEQSYHHLMNANLQLDGDSTNKSGLPDTPNATISSFIPVKGKQKENSEDNKQTVETISILSSTTSASQPDSAKMLEEENIALENYIGQLIVILHALALNDTSRLSQTQISLLHLAIIRNTTTQTYSNFASDLDNICTKLSDDSAWDWGNIAEDKALMDRLINFLKANRATIDDKDFETWLEGKNPMNKADLICLKTRLVNESGEPPSLTSTVNALLLA
jgi:hypothetical protein